MNKQSSSAPSAPQESVKRIRSAVLALLAQPIVGTNSADVAKAYRLPKAPRTECRYATRQPLSYLDTDVAHAVGIQTMPTRFISLDDICVRIDRSRSWAYANDIVPVYDGDGNPLNGDRIPLLPWEQLPPPRIKTGKKVWLEADVEQWLLRISARADRSANASAADAKAQEVAP